MSSKVVAITGASAGIGRECAVRLARRGHPVALNARRADRLNELVDVIRAAGGRAIALPGDVTRPEDMEAFVDAAVGTFGRLDVMICNAGIGFHGSLDASTVEVMRELVEVNLLGTMFAARAAYAAFLRQGAGHLIAVSSVAGVRGVAGASVYSATKAAQIGFIEGLRAEFLGSGLQASVVYPVSTRTDFREAMHRRFGHAVHGKGPSQDPGEVADAVVRCVARPRPEVYPYWPAKLLRVLNATAPATADRLMRRFSRRQRYTPDRRTDR